MSDRTLFAANQCVPMRLRDGFRHFGAGVLASLIVLTSVPAGAVTSDGQPAPPTIKNLACDPQQSDLSTCETMAGWHWFRKTKVVMDPALKTMGGFSTMLSLTLLAQWVGGEAPVLTFLLTVSKAGVKAGAIVFLGAVAATVVATAFSASGFFFGSVRPAGVAGQDDRPPGCSELMAPYVDAQGNLLPGAWPKLLRMREDEFTQLSQCLPKEAKNFLVNGAVQGQVLQSQN